jgi:cytochrome c556
MRVQAARVLTGVLVLLASACAPRQPAPEYRISATIKDLMESIVDPNSDSLWESVSIDVTSKGVITKAPQTDQDWATLRNSAIALMEASNLLQMPGRHVAHPGEKSANPGIEETPEAIELLISRDRTSWIKHAHGLYDAAAEMLKAIDAKNTDGVSDAGEVLDEACENCHTQYWYPHQLDYLRKQPKTAPSMAPGNRVPGKSATQRQ